jgi:hypothetical protein
MWFSTPPISGWKKSDIILLIEFSHLWGRRVQGALTQLTSEPLITRRYDDEESSACTDVDRRRWPHWAGALRNERSESNEQVRSLELGDYKTFKRSAMVSAWNSEWIHPFKQRDVDELRPCADFSSTKCGNIVAYIGHPYLYCAHTTKTPTPLS